MTDTDTDTAIANDMVADARTGRVPKARYLSGAFAGAERERLWRKVWQWACLESDVPEPGSYYEHELADQSILLLRGDDGELRAFHNVCPHRGNLLRSGSGTLKQELACHYHRWTWDMRGALRSVPSRDGFPAFDDACFALREVKVDTWCGMVFVNPDPAAGPLSEYLAPLPERLAPYHFEEHTRTSSVTLPLAANWKTLVDGFLDVYHLQGVHPQLLRYTDDIGTTYETFGRHSAMYMPMGVASQALAGAGEQMVLDELAKPGSGIMGKMLRQSPHFELHDGKASLRGGVKVRDALVEVGRAQQATLQRDYHGLTDEQLIDDHHYFFFPNVIVNVFAGHFIAARIRPHPDDHERCYFDMSVFNWLTPEEKAARPVPPHRTLEEGTDVGRVPDQDFTALPKVQRGMHSDGIDSIFLSTRAQEQRVMHFHVTVDGYLFG